MLHAWFIIPFDVDEAINIACLGTCLWILLVQGCGHTVCVWEWERESNTERESEDVFFYGLCSLCDVAKCGTNRKRGEKDSVEYTEENKSICCCYSASAKQPNGIWKIGMFSIDSYNYSINFFARPFYELFRDWPLYRWIWFVSIIHPIHFCHEKLAWRMENRPISLLVVCVCVC